MIPSNANAVVKKIHPSQTYAVKNNRIASRCDNLEAIRQAAKKILTTQRYAHPVYTGNYGSEIETLMGAPVPYVEAVAETLVREALTADDRIKSVSVAEIVRKDDGMLHFTVVIETDFGRTEIKT